MEIKISVIIPCCNAEEYLKECLDSVLGQTLEGVEVICVDDGSTDNTPAILNDYASKYKNVVVLRQDNLGSGPARNNAVSRARGKYIAFMDSDDFYYSNETLSLMYEKAQAECADICGGSACNYRNGIYTYSGLRPGMVFDREGWISKEEFVSFAGYWRFIYNRKMIVENGIRFPGYRRCQDPPFFLGAIAQAGKVYCLKDITYCYRKEHKKVVFDEVKAVHFAMGIRDSLKIAKEAGMKRIFAAIINDIHGELSALIYRFAAYGNEQMSSLAHEMNEIMGPENKEMHLLEGGEIKQFVGKINDEKREFFSKLNEGKKVLVFGAGVVGRQAAGFLKDNNIRQEAFVVSDTKQNDNMVDGIKVKNIDDYISIRHECVVIIATFPYLHREITDILGSKGFEDIYALDLERFFLYQDKIAH